MMNILVQTEKEDTSMNNTFLYIVTVAIWGSTWIAINYQLGEVAPEVSVAYRFGLAALMIFIICFIKQLPLKFSLKEHTRFFIFGSLLFGANYFFLYMAQQHINSALTCIGFSTLMLMNIINAKIWYKTKITAQVYIGGGIGLFGIIVLFSPQLSDINLSQSTVLGLTLCLVGTGFASFGNMLSIKNQKLNLPIMQTNAWGMAYGATMMVILSLINGTEFTFEYTVSYIGSLLYLSVFGSVIAFGCYLTLLTRIGAHKASYATIMFPAIAVLISTFVENFEWHIATVIGFICILIGNLIVLSKPKSNANSSTHSPELKRQMITE